MPPWVSRAWDGPVTQLRAEYSFALAHLCACPPPVALQMRILDFARMLCAIDAYDGQMRRASGG
jgi:hypothetical protein